MALALTAAMTLLGKVAVVSGGTPRVGPRPAADLAPYPPMHWHSWNTFCAEDLVNETNMREMADALLTTGMADAGYRTVNVVCNGWTGRDPTTHVLQENKKLWPDGIASLGKYLHSKGLQLGCYTSPANTNCCGEPGSLGFEAIDMETFAQWGCDHVMVDWCRGYHDPLDMKAEYAVIGEAIANSSNPNMIYGVWPGGSGKSWKWSAEVGGHYWRTANDIQNSWGSVLHNFDVPYSIPSIETYTTPGRYTFLDQMVVGVVPHPGGIRGPGLSHDETIAHMSMWVMAASPLLTCNDVRNMSAGIKEVLTNPEVLAVHKDPAARMAVRIDVGGGINEGHAAALCSSEYSVYGRVLSDNSSAVMALNRGASAATVSIAMEDVGDSLHTTYGVRDLWAKANVSAAPTVDKLSVTVPAHGVRLLRLWPMPPAPPTPSPPLPQCPTDGWEPHAPGYWYNTDPCPKNDFSHCVEDKANGTVAACAAKCEQVTDCVAFEVFLADPACYIFHGELTPPFKAYSGNGMVTCLKKKGDVEK